MRSDENYDDKLIEGHEYDGIQELDNPLPQWWLLTFYATIVFSVFYYGYYEVFDGPSHDEQLQAQMEQIEENRGSAPAPESAGAVDIAAIIKDPEKMKIGEQHYQTKCAACHAPAGQGLIGPNLTDKYWIHSKGNAEGILAAIEVGFPDKGMPPWGAMIPVEERPMVVAYVISLQGTNPENPKEPQGELVE